MDTYYHGLVPPPRRTYSGIRWVLLLPCAGSMAEHNNLHTHFFGRPMSCLTLFWMVSSWAREVGVAPIQALLAYSIYIWSYQCVNIFRQNCLSYHQVVSTEKCPLKTQILTFRTWENAVFPILGPHCFSMLTCVAFHVQSLYFWSCSIHMDITCISHGHHIHITCTLPHAYLCCFPSPISIFLVICSPPHHKVRFYCLWP